MTSKTNGDCRVITICNQRGLHARASAKFVTTAGEYNAKINVLKDGMDVCGTSIMGLMMLAAAIGEQTTIKGDGPEKDKALDALEALINDKFGEEC